MARKTLVATNSTQTACIVASVLSATTVVTEATAHRVTASAAKTPSALPKCTTKSLLQTQQRKRKKAITSPARMSAKGAVVDGDGGAALSAAHARTRTANRWTTHKRL